ncbi:hypothetical protein PC116_g32843 [Phytophthora cactorum]|nr:hypothetical protein PC116_g32843 [Phytophthora cactorum]
MAMAIAILEEDYAWWVLVYSDEDEDEDKDDTEEVQATLATQSGTSQ